MMIEGNRKNHAIARGCGMKRKRCSAIFVGNLRRQTPLHQQKGVQISVPPKIEMAPKILAKGTNCPPVIKSSNPALMIMFAIDMFHQIRKCARTTQVANRGTILKRTTAPYRQEQKTQKSVFFKIQCPLYSGFSLSFKVDSQDVIRVCSLVIECCRQFQAFIPALHLFFQKRFTAQTSKQPVFKPVAGTSLLITTTRPTTDFVCL